jgi:hypothetical protein
MVGSVPSALAFDFARERVDLVAAALVAFVVVLVLLAAVVPSVAFVVLVAAVLVLVVFDAVALVPAALVLVAVVAAVLVPVAFSLSSGFVAFVARVRFVAGLVSFSTVAVVVFLARLRVVFGACSELEPEVTAVSPRIWAQNTPLRSRGVKIHLSTGSPDTQTRLSYGILPTFSPAGRPRRHTTV